MLGIGVPELIIILISLIPISILIYVVFSSQRKIIRIEQAMSEQVKELIDHKQKKKWNCTCGNVNEMTVPNCPICGIKRDFLLKRQDTETGESPHAGDYIKEESKRILSVEELKHFPFNDFEEFKKAYGNSIIQLGVDRGVALNWAQRGIYSTRSLRTQVLILSILPFLAAIGFIIYSVVSGSWLSLLGLPLLPVGYFLFHPGAKLFGFIRSGFIFLTFAGFLYSIYMGKSGLMALTITLVIIWYATKRIYQKAVGKLISKCIEYEDLLCLLWQGKSLNIRFSNGNTYWVDFKTENGQYVHYD